MELNVKMNIKVPKVPTFIMYEEGDGKVSVGDLSDEQLRQIGEAWTDDLLTRAGEVRMAKTD